MDIISDNSGQGAAEYILLFGGVIIIAIAVLWIYKEYFNPGTQALRASEDLNKIRTSIN
jgi:hypothetical protein